MSIIKMVATANSLRLPLELQREVFSFCDSHTLTVTCLLARDLLGDSRDILYHTVKIDDHGAAGMVSNASQLIPRIRYLHAIITSDGGDSASWVNLFTILKNANVIGTLNLIPPLNKPLKLTPEITTAIDELSKASSIHTFMAVWPAAEQTSQFGWSLSSLALWGSRLKGLRVPDYLRYEENPSIVKVQHDKPVLEALELGQFIDPAPTSFRIDKVRKFAVMIGSQEFNESQIRDMLNLMAQTLELFVVSWYGTNEIGPTFPQLNHPLTSLATLAIFFSTQELITAHNLPFLQAISSCAPNLYFALWDASLEEVLIGNETWKGVVGFICKVPSMKRVDIWLYEGSKKEPSNRNLLAEDLHRLFARFTREGRLHITWDGTFSFVTKFNWWDLWPFFD
ncbi:hypothetical protein DL96DRAFT_1625315 [Flagelloscypha sp. PMI_526]|nr:hypothetical protein DL96DRAFT_1625315 [Flagelloscypha sp. PMI_526]